MHRKRKTMGFSLIETLVVCVIVGILAAVSIPVYIAYVNNQRQQTVNNLCETACAAANAYYRRTTGTFTSPIAKNTTPLFLYFNDTKYVITASGSNITVKENMASGYKTQTMAYK